MASTWDAMNVINVLLQSVRLLCPCHSETCTAHSPAHAAPLLGTRRMRLLRCGWIGAPRQRCCRRAAAAAAAAALQQPRACQRMLRRTRRRLRSCALWAAHRCAALAVRNPSCGRSAQPAFATWGHRHSQILHNGVMLCAHVRPSRGHLPLPEAFCRRTSR